ncbi:MAG: nucleotidyltransferase domain-containing protein [Candidatus Freyarchaeum deiterrae]
MLTYSILGFRRGFDAVRSVRVGVENGGNCSARGEAKKESDVDVLLIVKDKKIEKEIVGIAVDALLMQREYVSPKTLTEGEFDALKNTVFIRNVFRQGGYCNCWMRLLMS